MPLGNPPAEYLDFELRIWGESGHYYAQVTESPQGSSERVALDAVFESPQEAENHMLRLENALLRGGSQIRAVGAFSIEEKALRDFGQLVFDNVFRKAESIANLYAECQALVEDRIRRGEVGGLRLKLRIDAPDLAQFPWEYLYNGGQREWLGLLHRSPIIRRLDVVRPDPALPIDGPLNILGMIANPGGSRWKPIDAELERRRIDQAVEPHQKAGRVNLCWVPGETAEDLLTMVGQGDWHVFHFIGHGGPPCLDDADGPVDEAPEGFIVLSDGHGGEHQVRASELRLMLQGRGAGSLRLVVLNCCESARGSADDPAASPGAALVRAGVPAVVAMQFPISNDAAVQMSSVFYEKLAEGWPIEAALTQARQLMWAKSRIDWGIPVLYMRSKSGRLFTPAPLARGARPAELTRVTDRKTSDARARLRELYHVN
jgi:hypothetical protein